MQLENAFCRFKATSKGTGTADGKVIAGDEGVALTSARQLMVPSLHLTRKAHFWNHARDMTVHPLTRIHEHLAGE